MTLFAPRLLARCRMLDRWSLYSLLLLFAYVLKTNPRLFGQKSVMNVFLRLLYPGVRTRLCSPRGIHSASTFG